MSHFVMQERDGMDQPEYDKALPPTIPLPCHDSFLYAEKGSPNTCPFWLRFVSHVQSILSRPISTYEDLKSILFDLRCWDSAPQCEFYALKQLLNNESNQMFVSEVVPSLLRIALELPELFPSHTIMRLRQKHNDTLKLTKKQVLCLAIHIFLGSFETTDPHPVDFFYWLKQMPAFLQSLLTYFHRATHAWDDAHLNLPVCIQRRHLTPEMIPHWESSTLTFDTLDVQAQASGGIALTPEEISMDFANQFIGGGALCGGCVQEEIMFGMSPECILTMLVSQRMSHQETIWIYGAECIGRHEGYGSRVQYAGEMSDDWTQWEIVAFDALMGPGPTIQFGPKCVMRELNKAYCAFRGFPLGDESLPHLGETVPSADKPIATGNWGCGAFAGNKQLKAIEQILAATMAQRTRLIYYTFRDEPLADAIQSCMEALVQHGKTVGWVIGQLQAYYEWIKRGGERTSVLNHLRDLASQGAGENMTRRIGFDVNIE